MTGHTALLLRGLHIRVRSRTENIVHVFPRVSEKQNQQQSWSYSQQTIDVKVQARLATKPRQEHSSLLLQQSY